MDKQLNIYGIKILKIDMSCSIKPIVWSGRWSSMQWHSAPVPTDINKIEYLALSQGDKSLKQFTMENCMTDWVQSVQWSIDVF